MSSATSITREMVPLIGSGGIFLQASLTAAAQTWTTIATAASIQGTPFGRALVSVSGFNAVMRMDGNAPTAAIGHVIPAGYQQVWEGEWLRNAQWINQTGSAAVLTITLLAS